MNIVVTLLMLALGAMQSVGEYRALKAQKARLALEGKPYVYETPEYVKKRNAFP